MNIISVLYLIASIFTFLIAYEFYISRNGLLRKLISFLFISYSISLLMEFVVFTLVSDIVKYHNPLLFIPLLLTTISTLMFYAFIKIKFRR